MNEILNEEDLRPVTYSELKHHFGHWLHVSDCCLASIYGFTDDITCISCRKRCNVYISRPPPYYT